MKCYVLIRIYEIVLYVLRNLERTKEIVMLLVCFGDVIDLVLEMGND